MRALLVGSSNVCLCLDSILLSLISFEYFHIFIFCSFISLYFLSSGSCRVISLPTQTADTHIYFYGRTIYETTHTLLANYPSTRVRSSGAYLCLRACGRNFGGAGTFLCSRKRRTPSPIGSEQRTAAILPTGTDTETDAHTHT